jgi:hypothetical protein
LRHCRQTANRLQAQFVEHPYKFQTIQFWITEIQLDRQNLHDDIRIGRLLIDNLDVKILAILDKSLFESTRSIAETLHVAHLTALLHLHDLMGFRSFYLY